MQTVQAQVTQLNELIVFGVGMAPELSASMDQGVSKCETDFDDKTTCSYTYTKNK